MLGLYTRNGWRAGIAIAVTGTLVGLASSAAVAAPVTKAEAQGIHSTGPVQQLLDLDTGDCITAAPVAYPGTGPDHCGEGLSTNTVAGFAQAVQGSATNPASLQGTPWAKSATILQGTAYSRGYASTDPIDIDGLGEISLTDIFDGLAAANTDTLLDPILQGLGGLLTNAQLQALLVPLSDGLQDGLDSINEELSVDLVTGEVESQCQATGSPRRASAASTVADLSLIVGEGVLGADGVVVPLTGPNGADTPPNTNLLVEAPQELVNAVLDTLEDALLISLDGAFAPLAVLFPTLKEQVVGQLLDALEPTLLQSLSDGLEPLIQGTVNKQTPDPSNVNGATGTNSTGSVEVIGLEIILFDAAGPQGRQLLQLARSECGVNAAGIDEDDDGGGPPDPDDGDDDGDDSDGDDSDGDDDGDDDEPRVVDSGINDGGNLGALAITGLLAASTLVGSAARQRLLLDQ